MQNIKKILAYNAVTGLFTWLPREGDNWFNSRYAGKTAGHMTGNGYWSILFDGKNQLAHRLAWLYHYGEWPSAMIDHINRNRSDNSIVNLRDVTALANGRNSSGRASKSGIPGIHKALGKYWEVCIVRGDKRYRMGPYKELDKAKAILTKAQSDETWLLQQSAYPLQHPELSTAVRDMDHKLLLQLVFYDPQTGFFHQKKDNKINLERRLGYMCGRYRRIKVLNRRYPEHVLALFYMSGIWPQLQVDHVNGNPVDNRYHNLREVSASRNAQNRRSKNGVNIGIRQTRNKTKRWEACVTASGQRYHLGTFDTKEAAQAAWFDFRVAQNLVIPHHLTSVVEI